MQILKEVLNKINPSKEEIKEIEKSLREINKKIKEEIEKQKIKASLFIGGSYAKKTLIKKGMYDVDVFLRFDNSYKEKDISNLTEEILKRIKINYKKIHGSRDYFKLDISKLFFIELIPVIKVKKSEDAKNITDLSYFHVSYIKKKIKDKKILDEIKIAKAFCYAQNCYGAESYIQGFSGYSLELLICYYKSFLKFIKEISKINIKEKKIIDIEKLYKNKTDIFINMNSSKMQSPIILIDPTYKERNALAALSEKTFDRFKKACSEFLKKPNISYFEEKKQDLIKIKERAKKEKLDFIFISLETNKQEGDIAGTKLLKFFNYLLREIEKFYLIKNKAFEYLGEKSAKGFLLVKSKEFIEFNGPFLEDKKNCDAFKKKHKNVYIKNKRLYAKEIFDKKIEDFLKEFISVNSQRILDMGITNIKFEE
jgi:tRNA CCA-adding enzyme